MTMATTWSMASRHKSNNMAATTVVSAPGKVLLTGGYLVLERPHTGMTAGVSARFYVSATTTTAATTAADSTATTAADGWTTNFVVRSPQFGEVRRYAWQSLGLGKYQFSRADGDGDGDGDDGSPGPNPYVGTALAYALGYVCCGADGVTEAARERLAGMGEVELVLVGDNDFYSQRELLHDRGLPLTADSLAALPPFLALDLSKDLVKTGLGSSAALITALVAAVLEHTGALALPRIVSADVHAPAEPPAGADATAVRAAKDRVHYLAQAAHCAAQGKIGSGFDVSSATYGSQKYTRFSPERLAGLSEALGEAGCGGAGAAWLGVYDAGIFANHGPALDAVVEPWTLPQHMHLVLGDCGVGSKTPGMVRRILAWRDGDDGGAARQVWDALGAANAAVEGTLGELAAAATASPQAYDALVAHAAAQPLAAWAADGSDVGGEAAPLALLALRLRSEFQAVRALLREVTEATGVPVEPPAQTALIDATMAQPGVLFAGVPGAGGFDAVFALVLGDATRRTMEDAWARGGFNVCPLVLDEDARGGVARDMQSTAAAAVAAAAAGTNILAPLGAVSRL
ncbi:phosphomevalonate kinase [Thecamonas trahens ATCC 50062]|uniref:phosphomevalonate kinase n=1 Tax=Thecamonas trahens ATCC 50062 TaxID=461836 RepID=A0A0L0DQM5_THETB|nr:phosphomevalonate kinase [Thecamonas trahens ATCC 50062]KNC54341.1 phosphomevalonate kinase [Thecamonas trahens ATCC 50062]|eukprot:XP_013753797.1 phosphomevalonate kinase [Thecamonas trahens ATCC 50062]